MPSSHTESFATLLYEGFDKEFEESATAVFVLYKKKRTILNHTLLSYIQSIFRINHLDPTPLAQAGTPSAR